MAISLPVADPTIQPNNVRPLMSSPDILGEIDAAHASLSPPAQDAIAQAHGMVGLQPPAAPAMPSPALKPPPLATMGATSSLGGVPRGTNQGLGLTPPTPSAMGHTAELARLTAPPRVGSDPLAHTKADTGRSGQDQIKNPYARIPLNILDALGRGLVPGIEMGLPGTSGHHDVLVHQAGNAVKGDETARAAQDESALKAAQTGEASARADSLENPKEEPHTLQTANGIMQWNPATKRFDIAAGTAPEKEEIEGKTVTTDQGVMQWDPKTKSYSIKVGNAPEKENTDKAGSPEQQFIDEYRSDPKNTKNGVKPTVADAEKAFKAITPPEKPQRTLMLDPTTHKMIEVGAGSTVPEGAVSASGISQQNVKTNEQDAAAKKGREDAAKEYSLAEKLVANPSPTNDVALIMRYIGATKPDSLGKLRLNNNEINLVTGTRSTLGDIEALAEKVQNGQKLTPQQRQDMLGTMKILAGDEIGQPGQDAKLKAYADQYFNGDSKKAQAAIDEQRKAKK